MKIPDISRRRRDALLGKTVSLYSAPFYTSRFGYRLCLRVYLDGDGSGKGRYISYFLTIMKGEYDALLEWPFQHMVTMTLVNQKGNDNIEQSFRPSTSFHRPQSDINVVLNLFHYQYWIILNLWLMTWLFLSVISKRLGCAMQFGTHACNRIINADNIIFFKILFAILFA